MISFDTIIRRNSSKEYFDFQNIIKENLLEKDKFYDLELGKEIFALGFPLGQDNLKITLLNPSLFKKGIVFPVSDREMANL